uniref:Ribosomal protein S7 n=2 Tax=Ostreobium TaxID=121087 RepID=A0A1A8H0M6_9CHLO|nr:Ribosomal protein S7 [Ostreobium quekettii]ANG44409.1 ribosomal protein S7 [Ostreobium sp. OS1B]SBQ77033.1 Ribosomal protein S7 [Ostreobium quekettii]
MSRYPLKKKHIIKPDPFYDSVLIQKITNQLMKKGKKTLARKILNQTLQQIEKKTQQDPVHIIEQAISNTVPAVEIKARRIGGAVYSIPIELNSERGISIAIRWIIDCCNTKSSQSFTIKLTNEIIDASKKMGSAVRKRDEVHKMAESNARLM